MKIITTPKKQNIFRIIIYLLLLKTSFFMFPNAALGQSVPTVIETPVTGNATQAVKVTTEPAPEPQELQDIDLADTKILTPNAHIVMAPGNDNCGTALSYSLSPNTNCTPGNFSGASVEVGETFGGAGCAAAATTHSVWYSFIASQSNMWVDVKDPDGNLGAPFFCNTGNYGLTVWRWLGTCPPSGAIAGCKGFQAYPLNVWQNAVYNILNLAGLIPGATYLIQVTEKNGCVGSGGDNFCVAVGTPSPCASCATACAGMCQEAGPTWAPPPPCCNAAQVNQITATCPSFPMAPPMNQNDVRTNCYSFTAVNDTLWLQQIVYSWCNPNTYSFTFQLFTNLCTGPIASGNVLGGGDRITGLVVGTTYRICYTLQSACTWDSVVWPFAYTTATVLPVEMISFGAMPYKDKVKIYWATASEDNAREFIIERTGNAHDFTEIARIKASGNSTSIINYKEYDDAPLPGDNYYRIKQVDYNGNFTYTKLVLAKFSTAVADFNIIPNPTKDKATIRFNATGNFQALLKVYNMQGSAVWNKQFFAEEGVNEFLLNMNELQKGIYSVQLIVDDQNVISKLVKE